MAFIAPELNTSRYEHCIDDELHWMRTNRGWLFISHRYIDFIGVSMHCLFLLFNPLSRTRPSCSWLTSQIHAVSFSLESKNLTFTIYYIFFYHQSHHCLWCRLWNFVGFDNFNPHVSSFHSSRSFPSNSNYFCYGSSFIFLCFSPVLCIRKFILFSFFIGDAL